MARWNDDEDTGRRSNEWTGGREREDDDRGQGGARWGREDQRMMGRGDEDRGGRYANRGDDRERYRDRDTRYTSGQGGDSERDNRGWRDDRYLGQARERAMDSRGEGGGYDRDRGEFGGGQRQYRGHQGSYAQQGAGGYGQGGEGGYGRQSMGAGEQRWGGERGMSGGGQWGAGQGGTGGGQQGWGQQGGGSYGGGGNFGNQAGWGGEMRNARHGEHTGKGPKGYKRSDERLTEECNDCLTRDGHVDASNIEVNVRDGEVTLTGTVEDRRQKRAAEDALEHVEGIREIHNQLRVGQGGDQATQNARQVAGSSGKTGVQKPRSAKEQGGQHEEENGSNGMRAGKQGHA